MTEQTLISVGKLAGNPDGYVLVSVKHPELMTADRKRFLQVALSPKDAHILLMGLTATLVDGGCVINNEVFDAEFRAA